MNLSFTQMVSAQSHIFPQGLPEEVASRTRIQCSFLKSRPGFSFQNLDLKIKERKKKENGVGESPLLAYYMSIGFTG